MAIQFYLTDAGRNAVLSAATIAQLSAIAVLLVVLASAVSSFYAMKFEPMRILRERN